MKTSSYATTPDGRYFVVRGRLWRCTIPILAAEVKQQLVADLMNAIRLKGIAMRIGGDAARRFARQAVDEA